MCIIHRVICNSMVLLDIRVYIVMHACMNFNRDLPCHACYVILYSLKITLFTLFSLLGYIVTSVITSFGVNIEWTGRNFTRWIVNFHSTGVGMEWNSLVNKWIFSLHRGSELFTWPFFNIDLFSAFYTCKTDELESVVFIFSLPPPLSLNEISKINIL